MKLEHFVLGTLDERQQQRCIRCGALIVDASPEALANTLTAGPPGPPGLFPRGPVVEDRGEGVTGWIAGSEPGVEPCITHTMPSRRMQ